MAVVCSSDGVSGVGVIMKLCERLCGSCASKKKSGSTWAVISSQIQGVRRRLTDQSVGCLFKEHV